MAVDDFDESEADRFVLVCHGHEEPARGARFLEVFFGRRFDAKIMGQVVFGQEAACGEFDGGEPGHVMRLRQLNGVAAHD
jgi:hypothetical protein